MSVVRVALFVLALLAGALSAGFFYTFSILIMPALATADAGTAILAMQKINLSVRTPLFAFAFFGAPALALLTAAAAGWPAIAVRPGSRLQAACCRLAPCSL